MRDYNRIYKKFEKNDRIWEDIIFYKIYKENNIKRLRLKALTYTFQGNRSFRERYFHSLETFPRQIIDEELNKLLEWGDIDYGLYEYKKKKNISDKIQVYLIEQSEEEELQGDFQQTYNFVNKMILGEDNKGSKRLDLCEITLDTPCGSYFGIGII